MIRAAHIIGDRVFLNVDTDDISFPQSSPAVVKGKPRPYCPGKNKGRDRSWKAQTKRRKQAK